MTSKIHITSHLENKYKYMVDIQIYLRNHFIDSEVRLEREKIRL